MTKLPTARFSTDHVEPDFRFEAWRGVISASHDVEAEAEGFGGRVVSTRFDGMIVHVMRASQQSTARDAKRVRRDGLEHLVLYLNAAPAIALAGDSEVRLPSGGVSINDLAHPSRRSPVPELDSIVVSLSRELVAEARGFTDGLHGTILEQGAGALFAAHLRSLAEHAGSIEATASASVSRATAELLVACLDPTRKNLERARSTVETAALSRARRYVDAHLGDLALSPDSLARAVGVSRSTLFRLFEPFGGVARYITSQRLKAARRSLSDPRTRLRVSDIARRHGFASEARFSREFKRNFGISPSDYARLDQPSASASGPVVATGRGFGDWVRDLG